MIKRGTSSSGVVQPRWLIMIGISKMVAACIIKIVHEVLCTPNRMYLKTLLVLMRVHMTDTPKSCI